MNIRKCVICKDKGLIGRNHWPSPNNPCKYCGWNGIDEV